MFRPLMSAATDASAPLDLTEALIIETMQHTLWDRSQRIKAAGTAQFTNRAQKPQQQ